MTRPKYEGPADLRREDKVAGLIAIKWKCQVGKLLGEFGQIDRVASRNGDGVAFVEIKVSTYPAFEHPYFISLKKTQAAKMINEITGLPVFLAVCFTDEVRYLNLHAAPYEVKPAGRYDRDDPNDIEDCAHFDMSLFKWLCDVPDHFFDEEPVDEAG